MTGALDRPNFGLQMRVDWCARVAPPGQGNRCSLFGPRHSKKIRSLAELWLRCILPPALDVMPWYLTPKICNFPKKKSYTAFGLVGWFVVSSQRADNSKGQVYH